MHCIGNGWLSNLRRNRLRRESLTARGPLWWPSALFLRQFQTKKEPRKRTTAHSQIVRRIGSDYGSIGIGVPDAFRRNYEQGRQQAPICTEKVMEPGGFEPPTSWVRCKASSGTLVSGFPTLERFDYRSPDRDRRRMYVDIRADMRRYAGMSGTRVRECPKLTGGGSNDRRVGSPPSGDHWGGYATKISPAAPGRTETLVAPLLHPPNMNANYVPGILQHQGIRPMQLKLGE
jgi:hypothetical protein